ncbi:hypothetical protein BCR43DRAFT_494161 [Syncephalastrum racemosum]|uniref:Uncharacterized protein n=1 Tax=Syncephalastrum racemosum TaxID=13706 RepID=A0A1X2H7Q6_SYNRA|nr:hypothetical protein BCR43DRAFT_494161 [Syncephalastrum racemosum]
MRIHLEYVRRAEIIGFLLLFVAPAIKLLYLVDYLQGTAVLATRVSYLAHTGERAFTALHEFLLVVAITGRDVAGAGRRVGRTMDLVATLLVSIRNQRDVAAIAGQDGIDRADDGANNGKKSERIFHDIIY